MERRRTEGDEPDDRLLASADAAGGNGAGDEGAAPEADAAEEETAAPDAPLDPLAEARSERDGFHERLLRTAADFDNFRKRTRRDIDDARARGRDEMLREILPVLDNFERAVAHAEAGLDPTAIASGLAMVQKLLGDTLDRAGIAVVGDVGVAFDPTVHDAIQQEATSEVPAGTVLHIVQKGYRTKDRLVRPATVVVAVAPAAPKDPPAG